MLFFFLKFVSFGTHFTIYIQDGRFDKVCIYLETRVVKLI